MTISIAVFVHGGMIAGKAWGRMTYQMRGQKVSPSALSGVVLASCHRRDRAAHDLGDVRAGEDAEGHHNRRESANFDIERRGYIENDEDRHEQRKPTHDVDIAAQQRTEPERTIE